MSALPQEGEKTRLQKSQLCKDGKRRRDCVCVVEPTRTKSGDLNLCGKPMVGVVEVMEGWLARFCEFHWELFVQHGIMNNMEEKDGDV